jgi:hypothetical protein
MMPKALDEPERTDSFEELAVRPTAANRSIERLAGVEVPCNAPWLLVARTKLSERVVNKLGDPQVGAVLEFDSTELGVGKP